VAQIEELVTDGILQHARAGHTVRFSHDIFFEWAFFHVLVDGGEDWLQEIRDCGEPPAVARVVELLAQGEYAKGKDWSPQLVRTASSQMRSQWTRAWLLGPLAASDFERDETQFADAVFADNCRLLKKALVWFQAEKTAPNPTILAGNLPQEQRLRFADLLGWPSDFAAWRRLISFLFRRISDIPVSLYPEVLAVFEVWQNALAERRNPLSQTILTQCAEWLRNIDAASSTKKPDANSALWEQVPDLGDFRKSLSRLILRASRAEPGLAEDYFNRVIASERIRENKFEEIVAFSPTLAQSHPHLLVDLTLKHVMEELPDDQVAREGYSQFSHLDWDSLSIDRDTRNFWPPSPLREPFHSLFQSSPVEALRLLRELCNHAMTAWRQLHRHIHDSSGTPIPVEVTFSWGTQKFWGGDREYLWFRTLWAPKPLACGFMALEEWCFAELERGRSIDELIQEIVARNECIAILGVAVMLALHTEALSEAIFPLITSQRLWFADHNRWVQDLSANMTALMGFDRADRAHIEAIQAANAREVRKKQLRWLAGRYAFGGERFAERTRAAILDFKNNPPYQYEEHRNLPAARRHLTTQALEYAELADLKNYRAYRTEEDSDQIAIVHVSPTALAPEQVAKVEKANLSLQVSHLWIWASKGFESGALGDALTLTDAIAFAKRIDSKALFAPSADDQEVGMRRGAVAAAAAIALNFRQNCSEADLGWARRVLKRAIRTPEKRDLMWTSGAVIPWHQAIFVAQGLGADLREGTAEKDAAFCALGPRRSSP
jgi:hypothetical protein